MLSIDLGDVVEGSLTFERDPGSDVTATATKGALVEPVTVTATDDPLVWELEWTPSAAGRWVVKASGTGSVAQDVVSVRP